MPAIVGALIQLKTIAGNTFIEAVRQPFYMIMILTGIVLLILGGELSSYSMEHGEDILIHVPMALSTLFLVSVFLAAFIASSAISREVETRTVLTVVSKPITRPIFILGKYIGIAGAIGMAYFALSMAMLLTVRAGVRSTASDHLDQPVVLFGLLGILIPFAIATVRNYLYAKPFMSAFSMMTALGLFLAVLAVSVVSKEWNLQSPMAEMWDEGNKLNRLLVIIGLGVMFQAVLLLTAIAVAASTRFGVVPTLMICVGIFLLGLTSNALNVVVNNKLGIPLDTDAFASFNTIANSGEAWYVQGVYYAAKAVYLIAPNLQFLWPADAITQGHPDPLMGEASIQHGLTLLLYAGLQRVAVLSLAIALFQRREVG